VGVERGLLGLALRSGVEVRRHERGVPDADELEGAAQLRQRLLGAALVLQHEDLRALEVLKQARELEVVEAAAEGIERRVATRRHPTPARHARAQRER